MKTYKVVICDLEYDLDIATLNKVLTERAFKLARKTFRQGGELRLGYNSIKPELLKTVS